MRVPVFADLLGTILAGLPLGIARLGGVVRAFSVPEQFRDFGAGVIPLGGLVYFLALAAVMLYANMVLLGRRHWAGGAQSSGHWVHYLARIVCLIVALASLDVMVAYAGKRADVSAERINTLSPTSRELIAKIPKGHPVYIQAYYSPDVPREYVETKADLLNLLREVQALGGDRIRLNLVSTERYSDAAPRPRKSSASPPSGSSPRPRSGRRPRRSSWASP